MSEFGSLFLTAEAKAESMVGVLLDRFTLCILRSVCNFSIRVGLRFSYEFQVHDFCPNCTDSWSK